MEDSADLRCGRRGFAPQRLLDGVRPDQPALDQALQISNRAVSVGFEWDCFGDVLDRVKIRLERLGHVVEDAQRTVDLFLLHIVLV